MDLSTFNATVFCFVFIAVILVSYFIFCGSKLWVIANSLKITCEQLGNFDVKEVNDRFEDIKNIFENNTNTKSIWSGFEKTLVITRDSSLSHRIYSTVDADSYFNLDNVCSGISLWFWQNLGGIFTGAGILGTFWGLHEGLKNIDISETTAMQDSIGGLLSGLSTAFDTSLIGIAAALVFGFIHKWLVDKVGKYLNQLIFILEKLFQRRGTEQILADLYLESKQQTMQFTAFNSDLAIGISDALEQKLSQSNLAESLKSIDYSTENINKILSNELTGIIENAIDAKMTPIFVKLEESIDRLSNSGVEAIAEGLKNGAGKEITEFAGVLQSVGEKMDIALKNLLDTSNTVNNELVNAIGNVIAELDGSMKHMAKQYEDMEGHLNESIAASVQKMEEAIEKINQQTITQTENMAASTEVINQGLFTTIDNLKNHLNDLTKEYSDKNKEINDLVLEQIRNIQDNMAKHEKAMTEMNEQFLTTLDYANEAANAFKEAAVPVNHASNELKMQMINYMSNIENQNKHISNSLQTLSQLNGETNKNAQNFMSEFEHARKDITSTASQYHNINSELAKVLETISHYIENYNQQINKELEYTFKQYSDNIGNAIGLLSSLVEELKDELADKK